MNCPKCHKEVANANINVQTDVGHCQHCGEVFRLSENLGATSSGSFDANHPPKGAWIKNGENRMVIGATTRSPMAFFLVPFMLVWSGGSIGGIYGSQILKGEFDLFMSLFGIPFLIGSVIFWSVALMAIWGKVELTLDRNGGKVFTGIGIVGRTKKFSWNEIDGVKEGASSLKYRGSQGRAICLEGKRRISFGTGVKESRRYYLLRALQGVLSNMKAKKGFA